jgi:hypothetical protein
MRGVTALFEEPPFRLLVRSALRVLPATLGTRAHWDAVDRPHYVKGLLHAVDQAQRQGHESIAAIEFGVAEGYGLLSLQAHAQEITRTKGVRVHVYGFDSGGGLPTGTGDYRDHCDIWRAGDYRMDVAGLTAKLDPASTTLYLGDVHTTAALKPITEPVGFIALDLDFYSSSVPALGLLERPDVRLLHRVALYLDDVSDTYNHRFAGELLAVDEFNARSERVKIDRWRGVRDGRPFPNAYWLERMYLAHDLAGISAARPIRTAPARMR